MPRQDIAQDMSIQDHLNGDDPLNIEGFTDVVAPHKNRKEEFIQKGYVVIKESDNSDLIIVGRSKQVAKEDQSKSQK